MDKPLTKEQFSSLAELCKGMAGNKIPKDHAELMIRYGFAKENVSGMTIATDAGRKRFKAGK